MKKLRLDLEKLQVQSFATGNPRGGDGTVRAFSGDLIVSPSDWNPLDCAPSGVDTGSLCGCGSAGHSGGSCVDPSFSSTFWRRSAAA